MPTFAPKKSISTGKIANFQYFLSISQETYVNKKYTKLKRSYKKNLNEKNFSGHE